MDGPQASGRSPAGNEPPGTSGKQLNTGERRRVYEKAGFTALPLVRYYKALPGHTG
jgi:hypothetical protein